MRSDVVPKAIGIDLDAGAHRRGDRDPPEVATLRRGRLDALELIDDRAEVVAELGGLEADLADRDVHVAEPVGAVLDLAALELLDRLSDVLRHGAGLRVGHEPAR